MPVRPPKKCGAVQANTPDSEVGAGSVDSASASGGLAEFFFRNRSSASNLRQPCLLIS